MKPLYPQVVVKLTGCDSNAFVILGKVNRAAKKHLTKNELDAFMAKAMGGDYNNLLATCQEYFTIE